MGYGLAADPRVFCAVALLACGSAREALFWHVQQTLSKNNVKDIGLGFDCRVLFQRAQCAINVESPGDKLNANLGVVAKELAKVRKEGLSEEEFNALVAQKSSNCRNCSPPMPAPIPIS